MLYTRILLTMSTSERPVTPASPSPSPPGAQGAAPPAAGARAPPDGAPPAPLPLDEVVRRDLETRTRAVIDALYEVAMCVADVQPGSEALVGEKVCVAGLCRGSVLTQQQRDDAPPRGPRRDEGPHPHTGAQGLSLIHI